MNDYVNAIVDEGNGIAGLELSVFQALMLRDIIDQRVDPRWLTAAFYLRRRDLTAQAVSLYRSVNSGRFHSYQRESIELQNFDDIEYDYEKILSWLIFLLDCEERFLMLFNSCFLSPFSIFYEDLQSNPLAILQKIALEIGSVHSPIPSF